MEKNTAFFRAIHSRMHSHNTRCVTSHVFNGAFVTLLRRETASRTRAGWTARSLLIRLSAFRPDPSPAPRRTIVNFGSLLGFMLFV